MATSGKQGAQAEQRRQFRRPEYRAGLCPRNPAHTATRVYRTSGRTRYCKCNDCGENWKEVGDDALAEYLSQLADSLESAQRVGDGAEKTIVMTDLDAKEIANNLRTLVTTP